MRSHIFFFAFFLVVMSCNHESVTPSNSVVNLMNLKVGNYWVYDWFEIDVATGNVTNMNKRDSAVIEKDTVINGRTCFIQTQNTLGNDIRVKSIVYDSANSIYTLPDKQIILALDESLTVTRKFGTEDNTVAIGYYSLDDTNVSIEVPAGNFQSVNFKGRIVPQYPDYPYGVRYNDNYYTNNVGLVKVRTQIYSSPNDIEMRLIRYGNKK